MADLAAGKPPIKVKPAIQRYAWGDKTLLAGLLGLEGGPEVGGAEAWFGAHPAAPATALLDGGDIPLDRLVAEQSIRLLGEEAARRFGGLPYLMKVLSAGRPLSIQVHPDARQAEEGFARENEAGIPVDAPDRCYRDQSHKPELIVALTEMHALCGFRTVEQLREALEEAPELADLLPERALGSDSLREVARAWFEVPEADLAEASGRLNARLRSEAEGRRFGPGDPVYWLLDAAEDTLGPADRGLLFVFALELVRLAPGEGLYISHGVPHAYLRGAGVEIMAGSDNVIRCGLTPKHVDPAEMMRVVAFEPSKARVLAPVAAGARGESQYETPAGEFALSCIAGGDAPFEAVASGADTILNLSENAAVEVAVSGEPGSLELLQGEACLVPDGLRYALRAGAGARVFRATVPRRLAGAPPALVTFRGREPVRLAFGTSGLRGLVEDITDLEAYINARGFLRFLVGIGDARPGAQVALAGDLRPSTHGPERSILRAIARAVADGGMEILFGGRIPTPALMSFATARGLPSIMVTGSHIPFDRNGIKFNKSTGEVLKSDEAPILEAVSEVRRREYLRAEAESPFGDDGMLKPGEAHLLPEADGEARELYLRRYLDFLPEQALKGLRIALYEHSAVGRELLAEILRGLGAEVFPVGRVEGFVAIDTEAISDATLRQIQALADEATARFGAIDALVSTDGDSDRPMLLAPDADGRMRFVTGDLLGVAVADYLDADGIALSVSATDVVDLHFEGRGIKPTRTKIGSPWIISAMAEMEGERIVGWEPNGGFMTASEIVVGGRRLPPLATRDAVLPIVSVLHAAARAGESVLDIFLRMPARHGRAGLLDGVPSEKGRAVVELLSTGDDAVISQHFGPERGFGAFSRVNTLDGARLYFDNRDVAHVRPSGNAPQLRIYAVADTAARADEIVARALAEPGGILMDLVGVVDQQEANNAQAKGNPA
jgi:phosphomannomutase